MFYPGIFSSSEHDTERMRRTKDADLDYPMIGDEDSDSQRALCPEGKKSELFHAIDNYGCDSLRLQPSNKQEGHIHWHSNRLRSCE
jgi:hypothetical protein